MPAAELCLRSHLGTPVHPVSLPIASLYAITDEVHQRFVPGRSCQAADWAIDTAGAALGLLCAGVLLWLWLRYRTKKHDKN